MGSPSSQAPTSKALSTHLPWELPLTSRAGVLMSTGSITVNTFLARRAGTQGRCRVALMQYRTLPCLPSNEVTRVLQGGRKVLQGAEKQRHAGGGCSQRLRRMRDRDTEGAVLGSRGPPETEQWSLKPERRYRLRDSPIIPRPRCRTYGGSWKLNGNSWRPGGSVVVSPVSAGRSKRGRLSGRSEFQERRAGVAGPYLAREEWHGGSRPPHARCSSACTRCSSPRCATRSSARGRGPARAASGRPRAPGPPAPAAPGRQRPGRR